MALRGKQKSYLRSQAHHLNPIFQVGKGGVNDAMIHQIGEALEKRELIKVKILQNSEVKLERELANEIAEKTGSIYVDSIGKILIFFKFNNKDGEITKKFNEFKKKGKK